MKCVWYILLLAGFLVLPLAAQEGDCLGTGTWWPVGEGIGRDLYPGYAADVQGQLYIASLSEKRRSMIISTWTGTVWQEVASLPNTVGITSMIDYRDELYVGYLTGVGIVNGMSIQSGGVLKWNGTDWEHIATLDTNEGTGIMEMTVYDDALVVAGKFGTIDGITARNIAAWNGTEWQPLGEGLALVDMPGTNVSTLAVGNGVLYAGGEFQPVSGVSTASVAIWDGTSWTGLENSASIEAQQLVVYNDELYIRGFGSTEAGNVGARWSGQAWDVFFNDPQRRMRISDMAVYHGSLYIVGDINEWEGLDWVRHVVRYNGITWEAVARLYLSGPVFLQPVGEALYACGEIYSSCAMRIRKVARFCDDEICGTITGTVFRDGDGNCIADSEDYPLANRIVQAQPGNYHAKVQTDGSYTLLVPTGSYTLSVSQADYWRQVCPPEQTYRIDITETTQYAPDHDFGFTTEYSLEMLGISIAGGPARPGREVIYTIRYENTGTVPFKGILRVSYDPRLTYQRSTPEANNHTDTSLAWPVTNLAVGMSRSIYLTFTLPADASLPGTQLCIRAASDMTQPSGADNTTEHCQDITGSYNSSMMVVSPRGTPPDGVITPQDTVLQYTIHFRNTGTDTAFKVVIFDKVPQQTDLLTLRPGAASHPYELDILANGELRWVFRDILLPDSTANEGSSHGYVQYTIQLKKNLPIGTVIRNAADIYFDYNEPVRTNEVQNVIMESSTTRVGDGESTIGGIYPNPANERITVASPLLVPGTIRIFNSLGDVVLVVHHKGGEQAYVDTGLLAPGVYFVSYPVSGGTAGRLLTVYR